MVDHSMMRLGRLPAKLDPLIPHLHAYRTALPSPTGAGAPKSVLYGRKVTNWGMMRNDSLGDCTAAAKGHFYQCVTSEVRTLWTPTDQDVVGLYAASTGYRPGMPQTDQGGVMSDVLKYLLKSGFCGHRIVGFGSMSPHDHDMVKHVIYAFMGADVGILLPLAFQYEDVWGEDNSESRGVDTAPGGWGGHDIYCNGYDDQYVFFISWGKQMKMTWAAWDEYVDEAYGILAGAMIKDGHSPVGFDIRTLTSDMERLRAA